jgi:hypothetical protein
MSATDQAMLPYPAEHVTGSAQPTLVSDELRRIMSALREACPRETILTFEYDGTLRVHIDARRVEDVTQIEILLPSMCGGIFSDAQRRLSANHSFFHRLSAIVAL